MEPYHSTTPHGRRPLTLAHVAAQAGANARPPGKAVHKWTVFRAICAAKARIGVSERALAVLDALLTFHPETALVGEGLIVFPSNQQLCLRAHGMAPATLRRHIAVLVDRGLVIRRDSPNGKRYARKGRAGEIEHAFGFDLAPLVARAGQFEAWAEEVRAEARALKLLRERITICRRDITKMIATGLEEGVPVGAEGDAGPASWSALHTLFRAILARVPRTATRADLEPVADELSLLAAEVFNILETHAESKDSSVNESQNERHKQNSNPKTFIESEPGFAEKRAATTGITLMVPDPAPGTPPRPGDPGGFFPLGMVLDACPDLVDYTRDGITTWRDFEAAIMVVRPMLGISPSAWDAARDTLGLIPACIVVAAILQKGTAVSSPGGYMRALTDRAAAGAFSPGPMLMALLSGRKRERMRA